MTTLRVVGLARNRRGGNTPPGGPAVRGWGRFAAPALVAVALLYLLPLAANAVLAFTDWSGFRSEIGFRGFGNFRDLIERASLPRQLELTIIYAVVASFLGNVASLFMAFVLERPTRINILFRAVFFIPVLLSPLAAGYVWAGILDPSGPLNQFIGLIAPGFRHAWLGSTTFAIYIVAAIDAWKWSGFFTLIYIAGLTTVPTELKEAAIVDGASPWKVIRKVKMPFLAPAMTFNITVTVIGALSSFDIIMATTKGGPGSSTRVLNVLTLDQFGTGFFGLASATSLIVSVLVVVSAIPLVWYLRRREIDA
ncbi:MAG: carbohydrate ABC transporter permease [Acidimicrobiia bacterium]